MKHLNIKDSGFTTKSLLINHILHTGGAYAKDPDGVSVYVPERLVSGHDLQLEQLFTAIVGQNHPSKAEICEYMVSAVVTEKTLTTKTDAPSEPVRAFEDIPKFLEVSSKVVEPPIQPEDDLEDWEFGDIPTREIDEMILASLEDFHRMTVGELFWLITGLEHKRLKDLSEREQQFMNRLQARCNTMFREGTLCAADVRTSSKMGVCKRLFARCVCDL